MTPPNSKIFYYLEGTNENGEDEYCYMLVEQEKFLEFYKNIQNETEMELENFGEIIKKGEGKPSDIEHQEILAKYGTIDNMNEKFQFLTLISSQM
jgi:hypothetical protein